MRFVRCYSLCLCRYMCKCEVDCRALSAPAGDEGAGAQARPAGRRTRQRERYTTIRLSHLEDLHEIRSNFVHTLKCSRFLAESVANAAEAYIQSMAPAIEQFVRKLINSVSSHKDDVKKGVDLGNFPVFPPLPRFLPSDMCVCSEEGTRLFESPLACRVWRLRVWLDGTPAVTAIATVPATATDTTIATGAATTNGSP
jgi:hypothetical protein